MARELKFDDDNSAQEAKLQLLQELSELEDLLAQRFEAMQAVKKVTHECMGGNAIHDGKTSFVEKKHLVPLPPAVSQALRHTQACYCMTCMNANMLHMHSHVQHACQHHHPSHALPASQDLDNVETMPMEMVAYDGPKPCDLNAKLAEASAEMPAEASEEVKPADASEEVKPKNGHQLEPAAP